MEENQYWVCLGKCNGRRIRVNAESLKPGADEFHLDRPYKISDDGGHTWTFYREVDIVGPAAMKRGKDSGGCWTSWLQTNETVWIKLVNSN